MNVNASHFESLAPELREIAKGELSDRVLKTAIPRIAKDVRTARNLIALASRLPTTHRLVKGDARRLDFLADSSVHLVVTSPPYWTLKEYVGSDGQLGDVSDYAEFVHELSRVWRQCWRVLVPGGRLIVVVGDVCLSRKLHGRHAVVPLHASIQESCRAIGFDNLATVLWYKIANAKYEVEGGGGLLGKPYEPNAVIKNDVEFILMQRKPGGYRKPSPEARLLSVIPAEDHREWNQQVWRLNGASTKDHPAPYPLELASRLVRMFSFAGDLVLDPFVGTGTTMLAAANAGRNSVGVEIEPSYVRFAERRLRGELESLTNSARLLRE
ncbi:MAG: site-specific DNA-methyltransferase [Phycisphaerales bacterium]|nr:site-specific DNA-methyltransferase [Phycisphaerales bacterium]